MKVTKKTLVGFLILPVVFLLAGCEGTKTFEEKDAEHQKDLMGRAQSAEPAYKPDNFLARKAINEWTKRMDNPDKLWYVYLMTESGAFVGYHICNTPPLSFGVSLTAPKQEYSVRGQGANPLGPSPGVDGVYYSNVDSDMYFCFDAETDSLLTFKTNFVYYDKPINIDAPELHFTND